MYCRHTWGKCPTPTKISEGASPLSAPTITLLRIESKSYTVGNHSTNKSQPERLIKRHRSNSSIGLAAEGNRKCGVSREYREIKLFYELIRQSIASLTNFKTNGTSTFILRSYRHLMNRLSGVFLFFFFSGGNERFDNQDYGTSTLVSGEGNAYHCHTLPDYFLNFNSHQ